jgi:hypothetical protein
MLFLWPSDVLQSWKDLHRIHSQVVEAAREDAN